MPKSYYSHSTRNFPLFQFQQTFQDVFDPLTVNDLQETTLSLLHLKKDMNPQTRIDVPPMEIKAFKMKLR